MKNKISFPDDFKLRLFIDTNVLIDYVQGCNKKRCLTFLNLFKKSKVRKKPKIADVELVTSDYVLWEFYGHCREESYVKWLISKYNYGLISANKECRNANFKEVDYKQMRKFGNEIKGHVKKVVEDDEIVYLYRLIGQEKAGLSETIDRILQCSRFSYKDAIVLTSAYFTQANIIITCDDQHFGQGHLDELKEALRDWQMNPGQLEYEKPAKFSTLSNIRAAYKAWFMKRNESKIIGEIVKYYPKINVLEIKCKRGYPISERQSICITKFLNGDSFVKFWFKVPGSKSGKLRNAKTRKHVSRGTHITVELPSRFPYKKKNWEKGRVFFGE